MLDESDLTALARTERAAQSRKRDAVGVAVIPFIVLATTFTGEAQDWRGLEGFLSGWTRDLTIIGLCIVPGYWLAWRLVPEGGPDRRGWRRLIACAVLSFLAVTLFGVLFLGPPPS